MAYDHKSKASALHVSVQTAACMAFDSECMKGTPSHHWCLVWGLQSKASSCLCQLLSNQLLPEACLGLLTLPKLMAGLSSMTRGSVTCPTSRKGTTMPWLGMLKDQKDSARVSAVGVYSNTIS